MKKEWTMIGAIVGDVVGSYYEQFPTKSYDFDLFRDESCFTDDTVLTTAVAEWLLEDGDLVDLFHRYVARYPTAGYGLSFLQWAQRRDREPYHSWGNGSAMRVSPVGWAATSLDDASRLAAEAAAVTHNHPDGIRGAVATAGCVFLARRGEPKSAIRDFAASQCGYDVSRPLGEIRERYAFDVSCSGSVPESIIAFLESDDFESALRNAVSLGGDADTMACIAGAIAECFYGGVPERFYHETVARVDLRILDVVDRFYQTFGRSRPYTSE